VEENVIIDSVKLKEILPHRYPFLMIDKVIELVPGESITAIKCVSINEPFFNGHFPKKPVMPGVLILEAMAQAGSILSKMSPGIGSEKTLFFAAANDVRWKKQVVPGDVLRIIMSDVRKKRPMWKMKGTVFVGEQLVASGEVTAVEVDGVFEE